MLLRRFTKPFQSTTMSDPCAQLTACRVEETAAHSVPLISYFTRFRRRRTPGNLVLLLMTSAWQCPANAQHSRDTSRVAASASSTRITLEEALTRALHDSPKLAASALEVNARGARAAQEGLIPNPILRFDSENIAGSDGYRGVGSAQSTLTVAQLLETAGKRGKRRAAALGERTVAARELGIQRLDTVVLTTKAFVAALAIQERIRLCDQLLDSAARTITLARQRLVGGAGSPVEPMRVEVQVRQVEATRARLVLAAKGAYASLAANWGQSDEPAFTVDGDFFAVSPPKPLSEMLPLASGVEDVRRAESEIATQEAQIRLEEARAVPDLTAGLGGRRFEDQDKFALVVELSAPLQLFNRNQDAIDEAMQRRNKARFDHRQAITQAAAQLRDAHAVLSGAFREAQTLRDETIPKAESVLQGAESAYRRGVFRAIDVLDARRTVYEVRSQYLDALAVYHSAQAEMDRWTVRLPIMNDQLIGETP